MLQPGHNGQPMVCLPFEDVHDESVGGKAWGLAQLLRMGLNVPPGFVICNAQAGSYPDDLANRCKALGTDPLAVRSSAQGEDGVDTSFAGQYESVLNVSGDHAVQGAIDVCVNSVASARAQSYIAERNSSQHSGADTSSSSASHEPIKIVMNIVVQRMVNARTASKHARTQGSSDDNASFC